MDKVILVMNDPTCCVNCPLLRTSRMPNTWVCGIPHNNGNVDIVFEPVDIDSDTKPNWCPLMPVPEEQMIWYDDGRSDWERGYNNCLREIIGE
jgi:hypothetical protein